MNEYIRASFEKFFKGFSLNQEGNKKFSRRDFLKLAGVSAAIAAGLSGCGPEDSVPIKLGELGWAKPLDELERQGYIYETEKFGAGPDGKPRYRKISFKNNLSFGGVPPNPLDSFAPDSRGIDQTNECKMIKDFLHQRVQEIIIIQENIPDPLNPEVENWVSMKIPGTLEHMRTTANIANNVDNQLNEEQIAQFASWLAEYLGSTSDPENTDLLKNPLQLAKNVAKAEILKAIVDSKVTSQEAQTIIRKYLFNFTFPNGNLPADWASWDIWSEIGRSRFSDIPESMPIETLMNVFRALSSQFGEDIFRNTNGQDYTDAQIMNSIMDNSGLAAADCIVVPKKADSEENLRIETAFAEIKKQFVEIQKKPRIFKVDFGGVTKMVVIHDLLTYDVQDEIVDWDPRLDPGAIVNEKNQRDGSNWQWLAVSEEPKAELNNTTIKQCIEGTFTGIAGKISKIEEFPPEAIEWFMVPNKFIGLNKKRLSPGLKFTGYKYQTINEGDPLPPKETKIWLFDKRIRDEWTPIQAQDQTENVLNTSLSMENWITDVTTIINSAINNGVKELFSEGLLSSLDWLSRALRGNEGDNFMSHPFLKPTDPYMRDLLADKKMEDLLEKRGANSNEDVNMAVFLEKVQLKTITLKEFYLDKPWVEGVLEGMGVDTKNGWWPAFNAFAEKHVGSINQDFFNESQLEINGRQIEMAKGDFYPVEKVITMPNGEKYLVLKEITDFSLLGLSTDGKFIVIPFDEAMQKVLVLDPDNNILKFAKDVVENIAVPALVIGAIVAPEITGGLVTAGGAAIKGELLKILASIGAKLIKTVTKTLL